MIDKEAAVHIVDRKLREAIHAIRCVNDPVYVSDEDEERHCNKCIFGARGGYCVSWECQYTERKISCESCLRQGCEYRDGTVRVNCPLWKESAV